MEPMHIVTTHIRRQGFCGLLAECSVKCLIFNNNEQYHQTALKWKWNPPNAKHGKFHSAQIGKCRKYGALPADTEIAIDIIIRDLS